MPAPWIANSPAGVIASPGLTAPHWANTGPSVRNTAGMAHNIASYTEYFESPTQPARTSGSAGCTRMPHTFVAGNTYLSCLNSGGIEVLRLRTSATNVFRLEHWNGTTWVTDTGVHTAIALSTSNPHRFAIQFSGLGTASGTLRIVINVSSTELVVIDQTVTGLDLTAISNVVKVRIYANGGTASTSYQAGELFLTDGAPDTAYGYSSGLSANGIDAVDGSGTFTAIDDSNTAAPDNDFVSLTASGHKRSFRHSTRSFGGRFVKIVTIETRLRCGATGPTQCRPYLVIGGVRYYHPTSPVTLTTAYANYQFSWELNPATSAPWVSSEIETTTSLEWGIEAI